MTEEKIYYRYLLARKDNGNYLESESISENLKKEDVNIVKGEVDNYKNLHENDSQMILITGVRKVLIKGRKEKPMSPLLIEIERVPLNTKNKKEVGGKLIPLSALMKVD